MKETGFLIRKSTSGFPWLSLLIQHPISTIEEDKKQTWKLLRIQSTIKPGLGKSTLHPWKKPLPRIIRVK
jgi:hypothetical protein